MNNGAALLALLVAALFFCRGGGGRSTPSFHGHGNTRGETVQHERRHRRVLDGLGVGAAGTRVWKNKHGNWEGVTYPRDESRWNSLSPAEQAAVFIAGSPSMGRRNDEYGCGDDLANVDARSSRSKARRIARRHL